MWVKEALESRTSPVAKDMFQSSDDVIVSKNGRRHLDLDVWYELELLVRTSQPGSRNQKETDVGINVWRYHVQYSLKLIC